MPGPAPKKNARRRNSRPDWKRLPAAGRPGDPPPFPLPGRGKALEALWRDLWASPQAVMWEQLGWTRVVARYAKVVLASEKRGAPTSLLAEARQLEDRLGLTPMAMRRLQWEISADELAGDAQPGGVASLDEYRSRLG